MSQTILTVKTPCNKYIHLSRYEAGLETWAKKVFEDMDLTDEEWADKYLGRYILLTSTFTWIGIRTFS